MSLLIISLSFGLVLGGCTWAVYRVFNAVPDEDRSLLDKPPLGFVLVWPLIVAITFYFKRFISKRYRVALELRLRHAGVQYILTAEQFFSAKLVSAGIAFLLAELMLTLLQQASLGTGLVFACGGFFYPDIWLRDVAQRRSREIFRTLPFYLDIITLSIEAGSNLTGGLTHAVQKSGDGVLRSEWNRVLRDVRAGKTRAEALRTMAENSGSTAVNSVVTSMIQAEKTGSSLGPILRSQSDQLRKTRFLKAEKLAMEAPVKLLGPLVMFIFPTTFFVIGFVILSKAMQSGLITWWPLVWAYSWPG